jgi:hypothetical protein
MLVQIFSRIFLALHDDHREERTRTEVLNFKIGKVRDLPDQTFIGLLLSATQILVILFILTDTVKSRVTVGLLGKDE